MYHGTAFTKMRLFFHSLFHYEHIFFFQLCVRYCRPDAYSSSLKHLSSSGILNFSSSSSSSAKQHPQGASFSGPKRWKMETTNSDCREDKVEQSTPPLQLPPLCGLPLSCSRETWFIFCLAAPCKFVVLTCLMPAHITLNLLQHLSPRIPVTRFLHCPTRHWPWL